jgi:hypothetical protein
MKKKCTHEGRLKSLSKEVFCIAIFAGILIVMLTAGIASAGKGGIPECMLNLNTCTTDLNICDTNLVTCTANLGVCSTNFNVCTTDLGVCTTELNQTEDDLEECYTDLWFCMNAPSRVLKTGQTACYDESGIFYGYEDDYIIDCEGTGQDGEIQAGVSFNPRFDDNGDETITDNATGLMWTKNPHLIPGLRTWSEALDECNALYFADYDDWRLPNIKELLSLVDYSNNFPALPSGHPFTNPVSTFFWSSTTDVRHRFQAWHLYLGNGDTFYSGIKDGTHVAWCVRDDLY